MKTEMRENEEIEDEEITSYHEISKLTSFGINAGDVNKLKSAGNF